MRLPIVIAITVGVLAGCGGRDEARVSLDLAALWKQSGQTVDAVSVRAFDEQDQLLDAAEMYSLDENVELFVLAGPGRRFEVEASFGGAAARIPSYFGERRVDLTAGQELQLVVPVFPAGGIFGAVVVVGGASIPIGTAVLATPDSPEADAPANRRLPIADGSFSGTLVDGAYSLSVTFTDGAGALLSGAANVTVVREQLNDAGTIQVAP